MGGQQYHPAIYGLLQISMLFWMIVQLIEAPVYGYDLRCHHMNKKDNVENSCGLTNDEVMSLKDQALNIAMISTCA